MQKPNAFRSMSFLYIGSFAGTGLGFLYWILIGRATNPDLVGQASTLVTILNLLASTAGLSVATGLPRLLGMAVGKSNYKSFRKYVRAGVEVVAASSIAIGIGFIAVCLFYQESFSLPLVTILVIVLTLCLATLSPPVQSGLISLLRTDHVAFNRIVGEVSRIIAGMLLVMLGFGALGVFLGFTVVYAVLLIMSVVSLQRVLKGVVDSEDTEVIENGYHRSVVEVGFPSYVPGMIYMIGTQIGTLFVFGTAGSTETGFYYMSMQIFGVAVLTPQVIMNLLFPYISANPDGDSRIMSRGVKYALVVSIPLVFLLLFYPYIPLSLLGEDYIPAALVLQILSLSVVPDAITLGVTRLAYSRGEYRTVLALGLLANAPRLILYWNLTLELGSVGAAVAFLIGSIAGVLGSLFVATRLRMTFYRTAFWKLFLPPALVALILYFFNLHWLIGIPLLLVTTGVAYARLQVVSKDELVEMGRAILPKEISEAVGPYMMEFLRILYGE